MNDALRRFLVAIGLAGGLGYEACLAVHAAEPGVEAPASKVSPTVGVDSQTRPGLLYELYELPRRPKTIRNLLPGVPPKNVGILGQLHFTRDAGFEGRKDSIQIEIAGEVFAPRSGEYVFTIKADDGAELIVANEPLGRNVWAGGNTPPTRGTVELVEGWHELRVSHYQGDGGVNLNVLWQPPGAEDLAPIPGERLRVSVERYEAARRALDDPAALHADDPAYAYRKVFQTQGFFELPEHEGDLMVDLLEGPTLYSAAVRRDFNHLLEQTNYDELPYWHQLKVLAGFLRGWPNGQTERGEVLHRAAYTSTEPEPTDYDGWRGAQREGYKQVVTFEDGHAVTVFTPIEGAAEQERVPQALAGLPAALRNLVRRITVEPYGTASEFNGGGGTIWVRLGGPASLDNLDSTFSHEAGHLLMDRTRCLEDWRVAWEGELLSLSHYARLNPFEDFAEFLRLYLSTNGDAEQLSSVRRLFPQRVAVMEASLAEVGFAWPEFKPDADAAE